MFNYLKRINYKFLFYNAHSPYIPQYRFKSYLCFCKAFFLTAAVVAGLTAFTFQVVFSSIIKCRPVCVQDIEYSNGPFFLPHCVTLLNELIKAGLLFGLGIVLFQTKRDFSNMGAMLMSGLFVLIAGSFIQVSEGRRNVVCYRDVSTSKTLFCLSMLIQ